MEAEHAQYTNDSFGYAITKYELSIYTRRIHIFFIAYASLGF